MALFFALFLNFFPTGGTSEVPPPTSEPAIAGSEPAIAGSELAIAGSEPSIAGSELAIAGSELPIAGSELAMAGFELAIAGSELAITNNKPGFSLRKDLTVQECDATMSNARTKAWAKRITLRVSIICLSINKIIKAKA